MTNYLHFPNNFLTKSLHSKWKKKQFLIEMNRKFNTNLCTNTYGDSFFFLIPLFNVVCGSHAPTHHPRTPCTPNIELERIILQIFVCQTLFSFLNNLNWEIYLIDVGRIVFSWLFVVWAWVNSFISVYYWKKEDSCIDH